MIRPRSLPNVSSSFPGRASITPAANNGAPSHLQGFMLLRETPLRQETIKIIQEIKRKTKEGDPPFRSR